MQTCDHPKSWGAKMCRACSLKAKWADPHFRARHAETCRQGLAKLRADPAFQQREATRLTKGRRKAIESGALHTPEVIAKRGRTFTSRRLSWCPPHLRDEYRRLLLHKKIPAAEAREIILAQWDAELERRKVAA